MKFIYLDLLKSESSASADLCVVPLGGTPDNGAKGTSRWPGGDGAGLLDTVGVSAEFASGLVEPRLHKSLPILVEMAIRNHIIPFGSHGDGASNLEALKRQSPCKQTVFQRLLNVLIF
jgi:hypothetical protein